MSNAIKDRPISEQAHSFCFRYGWLLNPSASYATLPQQFLFGWWISSVADLLLDLLMQSLPPISLVPRELV
jgi:hypothetical protein